MLNGHKLVKNPATFLCTSYSLSEFIVFKESDLYVVDITNIKYKTTVLEVFT